MIILLIVLGGVLLAASILSYIALQLSVLRHPVPDMSDPRVLRLTKWKDLEPMITEGCTWLAQQATEEVTVMSGDGKKLHGLFVPRENARGTLIFFHGFRSSYVIDFSGAMNFYHDRGLNLLIVDQRAHGKSQGRCITYGAKERYDAVSWTTYISTRLGEAHPVVLTGLSMGASTVLMSSALEHRANIRCIIADCGFTSPGAILAHVARDEMRLPVRIVIPFLNFLTTAFCGFSLGCCSTVRAMEKNPYPVFFIHGKADGFVPCSMTQEAYDACRAEKELMLVENAGHGMSFVLAREEYMLRLTDFLDRHL